ncbi:MAG: hypothetical protein ACRDV9_05745 [Acidimicrobiia bacterium]
MSNFLVGRVEVLREERWSWRAAAVWIHACAILALGAGNIVQGLRVAALEGRVAALESRGDRTAAMQALLTYHDLQLAGQSEALADWYRYRRARADGWGTGHYWAAVALRGEDR